MSAICGYKNNGLYIGEGGGGNGCYQVLTRPAHVCVKWICVTVELVVAFKCAGDVDQYLIELFLMLLYI